MTIINMLKVFKNTNNTYLLICGLLLGIFMVFIILSHSLGYSNKEGIDNITPATPPATSTTSGSTNNPATPNANPIVQVGINSASINSLREEINKLNIDAINKQLDEMEEKIKTNTDNITAINNASNNSTNNDASTSADNNAD
jgi:TolA-binding protein